MHAIPHMPLAQVGQAVTMPDPAAWVAVGAAGAIVLAAAAWIAVRGGALRASSVALLACVTLALKLALLAVVISQPGYEAKGAAHVPLDLWFGAVERGPGELLADPTFTLPALATGPALSVFGPEMAFVPMVNCVAIGVGAIALAAVLAQCAGARPARWALVWLMWNPASVYWGLHGLRDPFIFMALCLAAAGLVRLAWATPMRGGVWPGLGWLSASVALLAFLRPEVMVVPLGCFVAAALLLPAARTLRPAAAAMALAGAALVPLVASDQLGMDSISSESIEEVAQARLERAANEKAGGAGSTNFFQPGADFASQDFGGRLGAQVAGMIVCPYPVMPRGLADWTVAAESALWIAALALPLVPAIRRRAGQVGSRLALTSALCAAACLAMYAPLTVNAGNAFRLRYSVLPLASLALVLVAAPPRARRAIVLLPTHDEPDHTATPRAARA